MQKAPRPYLNIHSVRVMCIICCALLLSKHEMAQTFRAGAIVGLNLAQVDGDNYIGYDKLGLHIGALAELPLKKKVSLSFELLYDQKGAYSPWPQNISNPSGKYNFVANYANVPILIQYYDKPFMCVSGGFGIGQLVYQKDNLSGTRTVHTSDISYILDGRYFMSEHWALNFRYSYSLFPIGQYESNFYRHHNMYNNVISLRLLYMLGHRRTFK